MSKQSKQVIVMRKDLNMRRGKQIAQGAHAALAAYKSANKESEAFKIWDEGLFTKICVSVDSEDDLLAIHIKAISKGLNVALITDAGLTEFSGVPTKTCLAIGPNWSEDIDEITGTLKLL